jgi:hypothetical protein
MKLQEVPNAWLAAAYEILHNDPRLEAERKASVAKANREWARGRSYEWTHPDDGDYRDEAAHRATAEWGRRGGFELRRHRHKRHVIRIYDARRCAGVCGQWLIDLGIRRIDARVCPDRKCRNAYEAARRANERVEFWGPTVAAPAKRADQLVVAEFHVGVIDWLDAYGMSRSSPVPKSLLKQRDWIEQAREQRALDPIEAHLNRDEPEEQAEFF